MFPDVYYAQIDLCVLTAVLRNQFGFGASLADLVDGGADLHRRIAAAVLNEPEAEVTKDERQGAKAASFGRPGGMGPTSLKMQAKGAYGVELTDEEVRVRIDAYGASVPELKDYPADTTDIGQRMAERLHLTPAAFDAAHAEGGGDHAPAGWLGGNVMQVLRDPTPATGQRNRGKRRAPPTTGLGCGEPSVGAQHRPADRVGRGGFRGQRTAPAAWAGRCSRTAAGDGRRTGPPRGARRPPSVCRERPSTQSPSTGEPAALPVR